MRVGKFSWAACGPAWGLKVLVRDTPTVARELLFPDSMGVLCRGLKGLLSTGAFFSLKSASQLASLTRSC